MKTRARFVAVSSITATLFAGQVVLAQSSTTTRVNVDSAGLQANDQSTCASYSAVSADGRYVVFASNATNLVAGDTNGKSDVFVRDRQSGVTERVSVSSTGAQANGYSARASISADGRYVAFASRATNLGPAGADLFVRDRQTGVTESYASGDQYSESEPVISADGRYIVFKSDDGGLVPQDWNFEWDVFVRDRQTGAVELVSVSSTGAQGDSRSGSQYGGASISADGRYVAFASSADNLVAGDTNGWRDIFVRDRIGGTTERVNVGYTGAQSNHDTAVFQAPSISADGRYVAFSSLASNLVPGDTDGIYGLYDIFVRDRQAGTTERVSVSSAGVAGNASTFLAAISADGRFVVFYSAATNLVPGDTNARVDCFVRDRLLGTTERVSVDSSGAQSNETNSFWNLSISADGNSVLFESGAPNLVAGDTNGYPDVFVRDRGGCSVASYCTPGTTTNGCAPLISGTGTPSASASSGFTVSVVSVEGQRQGLVLYGVDHLGFGPTAWGATSYLCVKSPLQRTPVQDSGGSATQCDGVLALDWNAYRSANPNALGAPFSVGERLFAQGWFRDPGSAKTTNLSDALQFVLCP